MAKPRKKLPITEVTVSRRCQYRHVIADGEFRCRWRHPIVIEDDLTPAYVDIETSNLDANFGQIHCVAPDTPVLTADLTWVPARNVVPGMYLIGVDEENPKGRGHKRRLRLSLVEATARPVLQSSRVVTDRGTVIASGDHPFLAKSDDRARSLDWVQVRDLQPGREIRFLCEPWSVEETREAGWLAGMFEGEGWVVNRDGGAGIAQNAGPLLERVKRALKARGIAFGENVVTGGLGGPNTQVIINGGVAGVMRCLGMLQPSRLIENFKDVVDVLGLPRTSAIVLSVTPIGPIEVAAIQTSTRTLITGGFVSHNSYAIKPQGSQRVIARVIKERSLAGEKKLLEQFLEDIKPYNTWITYYGCVTPGHRVLTRDLRWVPIETLQADDELLGFDKEPRDGRYRHWREGKIMASLTESRPTVRMYLSDGTSLVSTLDHPWIAPNRGNAGYRWVATKDLKVGDTIGRMLPTWEEDRSYEAGWLAGFFDSEGSLNQARTNGRYARESYLLDVTATQQVGSVLDQAILYLTKLGIRFSVRAYDRNQTHMRNVRVGGGVRGALEFLGRVRPVRLLGKLDVTKLGSLKSGFRPDVVAIVSIEDAGMQPIVAMGTSTETYLAEGFGSSNTGFDVPFLRTRCMYHGLPFPGYGMAIHVDLYYVARHRLKMSSNRLQTVAEFLGIAGKTPLKGEVWVRAGLGDKEALKYILHHNIEDVKVLERVHARLEPFMKSIVRRSI